MNPVCFLILVTSLPLGTFLQNYSGFLTFTLRFIATHYPKIGGAQIFARRFVLHLSPNPNGVVSFGFNPTSIPCLSFVPFCCMFCTKARHSSGHNPVRVEMVMRSFPRVARCAQPWAMGRNPIGIRERENLRAPISPAQLCG